MRELTPEIPDELTQARFELLNFVRRPKNRPNFLERHTAEMLAREDRRICEAFLTCIPYMFALETRVETGPGCATYVSVWTRDYEPMPQVPVARHSSEVSAQLLACAYLLRSGELGKSACGADRSAGGGIHRNPSRIGLMGTS